MSQNLLELEEKASQLPDEQRAQLALFLLESLEPTDEGNIEEAWRVEAEFRLTQIERGEACLIPAEDVFESLGRRLS